MGGQTKYRRIFYLKQSYSFKDLVMDFSLSSERQILFDTLMKYIMNEYSLDDRNEAALSDLGFSKDR